MLGKRLNKVLSKTLSYILVLILVLGLIPLQLFAEESEAESGPEAIQEQNGESATDVPSSEDPSSEGPPSEKAEAEGDQAEEAEGEVAVESEKDEDSEDLGPTLPLLPMGGGDMEGEEGSEAEEGTEVDNDFMFEDNGEELPEDMDLSLAMPVSFMDNAIPLVRLISFDLKREVKPNRFESAIKVELVYKENILRFRFKDDNFKSAKEVKVEKKKVMQHMVTVYKSLENQELTARDYSRAILSRLISDNAELKELFSEPRMRELFDSLGYSEDEIPTLNVYHNNTFSYWALPGKIRRKEAIDLSYEVRLLRKGNAISSEEAYQAGPEIVDLDLSALEDLEIHFIKKYEDGEAEAMAVGVSANDDYVKFALEKDAFDLAKEELNKVTKNKFGETLASILLATRRKAIPMMTILNQIVTDISKQAGFPNKQFEDVFFTSLGYTFNEVFNMKVNNTTEISEDGGRAVVRIYLHPIQNEVTYLDEDGSELLKAKADYNRALKVPQELKKVGFIPKGFAKEGEEEAIDLNNFIVTGDLRLKTLWEEKNCSVSFDLDGGMTEAESQFEPSQTVPYLGSAAKPAVDPIREGHDFVGWQLGDKEYDFSREVTEDLKLKALWKKKTYTVSFDLDGGETKAENKVEADQLVKYLDKATQPSEKPTKVGHDFVAWQLGDKAYDFKEPVKDNITLKALWKKKTYTVRFDLDGGETKAENKLEADQLVEYLDKATQPGEKPTKLGHDFIEWQLDSKPYDFKEAVKDNITLKALWEKKTYTVSFDLDGGVTKAPNQLEADQLVKYLDKATQPSEKPTKVGHDFIGWQLAGKTYTFNESVKDNITIKALWQPRKYQVSFDLMGGVTTAPDKLEAAQAVVYLARATRPNPEPTKWGYDFVEWQLGGRTYDFTESVTADIDLKAVWKLKNYTVTFDLDGGVTTSIDQKEPTQVVEHNGTVTQPTGEPTKVGHDFIEWQLDSKPYDFEKPVTGNLNLKVLWKKKTYTVSFDLDGGETKAANKLEADRLVEYQAKVEEPIAKPTREGYDFVEWRLGDKAYDFNQRVESNLSLKALWKMKEKAKNSYIRDEYTPYDGPETKNSTETKKKDETLKADKDKKNTLNTDKKEKTELIKEDKTPLSSLTQDKEVLKITVKEENKPFVKTYTDVKIEPKKKVTREVVATLLYKLMDDKMLSQIKGEEAKFSDVKAGDEASKYISGMVKTGVFKGYKDGSFKPAKSITRAELAAVLVKFFKIEVVKSHKFTDLKGHWAENLIASLAAKGYVGGYPNGSFQPDKELTKAELATIVNRILEGRVKK